MATFRTEKLLWDRSVNKQPVSDPLLRTPGGFATCTAMFGNGVPIFMEKITISARPSVTRSDLEVVKEWFSEAVIGIQREAKTAVRAVAAKTCHRNPRLLMAFAS
jgi:hypothetical protein